MAKSLRNPGLGLWSVALLLSACLPNALSDDALHAVVLDATVATGGPLCGNGVVDDGESCDDGNTDACDACDKCQVRTVLDIKDAKSLAGLTSLGALQFDGKDNWSIETWFLVRTAPQALPTPFLVIGPVDGKGADTGVRFAMGVAPQGGSPGTPSGTVPFCSLQKLTKSTSLGPPVALNTWHHLRCVWNTKDGDMRASVDGGALATADNKLAKPTPAFDGTAWLLLGRIPVINNLAGQATSEAFDGQLDEVRAALGPNVAATALARRYAADTPENMALYHMDPTDPQRFLNDATSNQLDADQITLQGATPIKRDAVLSFAPEACYGYSQANANCTANPKPPWCE